MDSQAPFSILLVDDDPLVIRVLSRMLAEFAPLRFATSGEQALKIARDTQPDLILLDVEMPGMNGFDVCKALKNDLRLADVPVIFLTGHDSSQIEAMGLQAGAVDFITKPPHAPLVLARIRTYQRLKTLSDTLRGAVSMDFQTGACNRRHLEKTLLQELQRAHRATTTLSLLLVGIDDFKQYNTQLGSDAADGCLRAVAQALMNILKRPADLLARFSDSQFALLLPETELAGAQHMARHCMQTIDELNLSYPTSPTGQLTLSVGITWHDSEGAPLASATVADALIATAGQALDEAMSAGGHRAVVSTKMDSHALLSAVHR